MSVGLYIFCRDHRVFDNQSLYQFSQKVDKVVAVFILDPAQVYRTKKNKNYFSNHALQFMCESLRDLNRQCSQKLYLLFGPPHVVVSKVLQENPHISRVGTHSDFSAFATLRQQKIKDACAAANVKFWTHQDDFSLMPVSDLCKKDGTAYKKFNAFYQHVKRAKIRVLPKTHISFARLRNVIVLRKNGVLKNISFLDSLYTENSQLAQRGGRTHGLDQLGLVRRKKKYYKKYDVLRNNLDYETLQISGYLNFGCLSVREAFASISKALGPRSELLKQLWWRDFFLQAAIYIDGGERFEYFDDRFQNIPWKNSRALWKKIIRGETGFLIVDAGIQQMMQTGYMHNRARMIVGHFWTKYCLIDTFHPRYGSQVGYSKHLLDAVGISQNKLNQHWLTEFDFSGRKYAPKNNPLAGRPMDVSNAATIKRFDRECTYVKRWLPHLADVDNEDLYRWDEKVFGRHNLHVPPIFPDLKKKYKDWLRACKSALL